MILYREPTNHDENRRVEPLWVVPVEPDDVMNAAHKLVHPMYDNAADCDKFWCAPFRALKNQVGGETP